MVNVAFFYEGYTRLTWEKLFVCPSSALEMNVMMFDIAKLPKVYCSHLEIVLLAETAYCSAASRAESSA